ncbi:MAG: hypothetical protein ACRDRI_14345 [Pseudonocardiaceae bacterium]
MTTDMVLGMLMLVGVGGWYVGRWRAENRRAHFDEHRIWHARKNYRRKGSGPPPPPTL